MVFTVQAEDGETNDIKQMLDFANYAMRSAKTAAGGSCFLYDEQMRNKALLEQGLREGWRPPWNRKFEAYYQQKVDMDTGRIAGCEAECAGIWNKALMPGLYPVL